MSSRGPAAEIREAGARDLPVLLRMMRRAVYVDHHRYLMTKWLKQ